MHSEIIYTQIIIFGIVILVGVIASIAGIIDRDLKNGIARLVNNVTLPFLIVSSFASLDMTVDLLKSGAIAVVLSYISIFVLLIAGRVSGFLLKLDSATSPIHVMHTTFGNIVFLGFPLMNALFPGGKGLFFAAIYFVVSNSVMWTLGVDILNRSAAVGGWKRLKGLLNLNTGAFAIGIFLMLAGIKLPYVLEVPAAGLGLTTSYLAMLYIGALLAQTDLKNVFNRKEAYILSFNKMLLLPTLLILLFKFLLDWMAIDFDRVGFAVVILQSATPCMAMIVLLAEKYKVNVNLAAQNVFISTIVSVITLPIIFGLINLILN